MRMTKPYEKNGVEEVEVARTIIGSKGTGKYSRWLDQVQPADRAYESLVVDLIRNGELIEPSEDRTGTGYIQRFGLDYVVDVGASFPIITTKKVFFKSVVAELLWFLSGEPHINNLQEHTRIWDEWATEKGELETSYGRFWRDYPTVPKHAGVRGEATEGRDYPGIDQIEKVISNIKNNPHSRRHVVTAWHPDNAWNSKLPPCHFAFVFHVRTDDTLCLEVHQRSGDVALGIPFNMASYSLLLRLVARECGLEPGLMKHNITNAHIYRGHVETLAHQIQREPKDGMIDVGVPHRTLMDLDLENWGQYVPHFAVANYNPHPAIEYEVAV